MTVVNRRTFSASRGKLAEVVELLKAAAQDAPQTYRIYASYYGTFHQVVLEVEFTDMASMEAAWAEFDARPGTESFLAQWNTITEPGGTNEVWVLEAQG